MYLLTYDRDREMRNGRTFLIGNPEREIPLGRQDIKMNIEGIRV